MGASLPAAALLAALAFGGQGRLAAEEGAFQLPPVPSTAAVEYAAERFEYLQGTPSVVRLEGDAWLRQSTWTIRAQRIELDLDSRRVQAEGEVALEDGSSALSGEAGEFEFETKSGFLRRVYGEYPPWRVWARKGWLEEERKARFRGARFTSCGDQPPHYHFRAGGLRMRPQKYLTATNVLLYLGRIPIFYTPFLYKSLNPRPILRTRFVPGYDRRNGLSLRSTTLYSVSPALYGKLFLDYYGAQGPGAGSELQFRASEDARGALYAYGVRETKSGEERWTLLGDHYQTLGSSLAVQARLQAQSDPEFNNHYARSNAFRVTSELVNGAALVHRTSLGTARLSYSRRDIQDPADARRFAMAQESSPRLDFQSAQLNRIPLLGRLPSFKKRELPFLYTVNLFADNAFDSARNFRQRSAGGGIEAVRTLRLFRGASFTPRAAFREVYESRQDVFTSAGSSLTLRDTFTGRYDLGGNLRFDTPFGDWDLSHSFVRRMKPDAIRDDAGALDHGIEANATRLQHTLRPNRKTLLRLNGGYDFRVFRDHDPGFRRRVEPIAADIVWLPRRDWQVSLRDEYQLQDGNRSFLLQADWGDLQATHAGFGITHTLQRQDEYLGSLTWGLAPRGASWKLEGALRGLVFSNGGAKLHDARLFEKELILAKDFHDFHTRVLLRTRPGGVKEVLFRIDLRVGKGAERRIQRKDWESEWFPWRKEEERE